MTQALTFAAMLLFFRNETGFGGNNGFTDFKRILGFPVAAPATRAVLFLLTVLLLVLALYCYPFFSMLNTKDPLLVWTAIVLAMAARPLSS
jgi:ABC-type branched-subunit amino acid transport system permease subunit